MPLDVRLRPYSLAGVDQCCCSCNVEMSKMQKYVEVSSGNTTREQITEYLTELGKKHSATISFPYGKSSAFIISDNGDTFNLLLELLEKGTVAYYDDFPAAGVDYINAEVLPSLFSRGTIYKPSSRELYVVLPKTSIHYSLNDEILEMCS